MIIFFEKSRKREKETINLNIKKYWKGDDLQHTYIGSELMLFPIIYSKQSFFTFFADKTMSRTYFIQGAYSNKNLMENVREI